MGMKKIYDCNICRDIIEDREGLLGLIFSGMKSFRIGNYGNTDGVHICAPCARQLKEQLNLFEI